MIRSINQLFHAFERGTISRRQLLLALGAVAVAGPAAAFAQGVAQGGQGRRGGRGGRGRGAPRDTTPLVMPFEPTGWKTVWLDRLEYQCTDYRKAAAFYATLMGWTVRSDDGSQCLLDIGEHSGGIMIRGGLEVPPPPAITDAGLGVTRPPITAVYDGFAWGVAPWDEKAVEAALKVRGLNPVADHHGDYRSFRFKDPDGFNVAVTNGTKANRRATPAAGKLPAHAPFAPTNWNTLYLDHLSFETHDPRRSTAFYQALLGWTMDPASGGGGSGQFTVLLGSAGGAIIRGNALARAEAAAAADPGDSARQAALARARETASGPGRAGAAIGHISWGIENWDNDRVRAALIERGVVYVNQQGEQEPRPDMTGNLKSYHVPDAMGWDLQIGNRVGPTTYG